MGIDAALTDQTEPRQAGQERLTDFRTLADEDQRLGVFQPLSENQRLSLENMLKLLGRHAETMGQIPEE